MTRVCLGHQRLNLRQHQGVSDHSFLKSDAGVQKYKIWDSLQGAAGHERLPLPLPRMHLRRRYPPHLPPDELLAYQFDPYQLATAYHFGPYQLATTALPRTSYPTPPLPLTSHPTTHLPLTCHPTTPPPPNPYHLCGGYEQEGSVACVACECETVLRVARSFRCFRFFELPA